MRLIKITPLSAFKKLGLSDDILKVLVELGFEKPTEIQEKAIPKLLEGPTDMIGLAQTGTGKTAAFGLPLLELIDGNENYTQGLILAPTRELGKQIAEQLEIFSKYLSKVNVLPVYGGAAISNQIKALRKNTQHVIIATPGRLIDLIKRKAVKLDLLEFIILDEADEMLNMGFKEDIDKILSYTPEDKLTWLFSATMPKAITKIVKKYMTDPVEIKIDPSNEVNTNIDHQFAMVRSRDKKDALKRFLDVNADMRGVVFCRTKRDTQDLAEALLKSNYKADALHGDLSQAQRDRVMKRFKSKELQVLIATDVAARGIDVNDLTHVFHFTLPDDDAYYTHRSGRTARAGKKGTSIAFINGREHFKIKRLEKSLGINFKQAEIPNVKDIAEIRVNNWCLKVLETPTKNKLDKKLVEAAENLFGNLSKEELIAKVLMREMKNLDLGSDRDLNDERNDSGGGRGRDRDRGRGRGRGRDRKRGGGGRGHRKGGKRDGESSEGNKRSGGNSKRRRPDKFKTKGKNRNDGGGSGEGRSRRRKK